MANKSIDCTLQELDEFRRIPLTQLKEAIWKNEKKMTSLDREIKRLEAQGGSEWLIKKLLWKYDHRESRVKNGYRILEEREKEEAKQKRVFDLPATAET